MSQKVYQKVTDKLVELLEQGVAPWRKPWRAGQYEARIATNLRTGKAYRGVNAIMLGCCSPYASPYWVTYKQAQSLGGNVRKGEKGTPVVFWKWIEKEDKETGEKKRIPFLRYTTAFNAEQCEGLETRLEKKQIDKGQEDEFSPIERCEEITEGYENGPDLRHGGSRAFYRPSTDEVALPEPETFDNAEHYYATLFHEFAHSTGHESRLDRKGISEAHAFGSEDYSKEELVAEMAAAMLCGVAGIEAETQETSAAYLAAWIKRLKADPKLAVHAGAAAQKAADRILGVSYGEAA